MGNAGSDPDLTTSVETNLPAVRASEPDAVDRIVEIVRPFVLRWCRARVGPPGDDVAEEVCAEIAEAVCWHRPGSRPFLAEVVDITHAATLDAYRRYPLTMLAPEDEMRHLLDRLPEAQQVVLILRVIEGFTYEEVARLFGTTADDIRVAQHLALRDLAAMTGSPSIG